MLSKMTLLLSTLLMLSAITLGCGLSPPPSPTPTPRWTSYTSANYISAMAFDGDGNLWAVGSGGVVHWDVDRNTYVKYTVGDSPAHNFVQSIAVGPDGALWFGTNGGVSRYSPPE